MATIKVTSTVGADMGTYALPDYGTGTIAVHTPTKLHIDYPGGKSDEYIGSGLKYDGSNHLTGGTITGFTIVQGAGEQFAISGISVPAAQLTNATTFLNAALAGNDTITGGNGADHLLGGAGNDLIDGGKGKDTMDGGDGNDTFIIDNLGDQVVEGSGGASGIDTVKTSVAITTAFNNVENYTFTGKTDWVFTGNSLNNTIIGGAGNDKLDGGSGNDTLNGGAGNDTYTIDSKDDVVIDSGGASDTIIASILVEKALTGIENYTYTGSAAWTFTGTDANNILVGGSGSDTLDGGKGNDTLNAGTAGTDKLIGGLGNDTFVIDHTGVSVVEAVKGGIDTIQAGVTIDLTGTGFTGQEIENVTLTGSAKIDATGNGLDNVLIGNSGDNKLDGGDGNDTLNAGTAGADTLIGGLGNDTYIISHTGVTVTEAAKGGTDTIQSSITIDLTGTGFKDQEIENVILTGTTKINVTGNALDNVLTGNSGANILDGGTGNDTLIGGDGSDTYKVDSAGDKVIELATPTSGSHDLVQTTTVLLKTAFANVEDYTYTGGAADWTFTGNKSDNFITAGDGNDTLDGGAGNDAIIGGKGNDSILGGAGDDQIDGGLGNDKMDGGAGNDRYWIDSIDDTISDSAGTADRVTTSIILKDLITGIENYAYTGSSNWEFTGSDVANTLIGGSGADKLDGKKGDDILNGGTGADDLTGDLGNDVYVIDNAGDRIHEGAKAGTDQVNTALADTDLSKDAIYAGQEIEYLLLLTGAKNAIGNEVNNIIQGNAVDNKIAGGDGNDILIGEAGNDQLDGNKGNDTLIGGDGNDTYTIDSLSDKVLEGATKDAGSHDLIESSALLKAVVANVEDYTYTGSSAWTFTGSKGDNILTGGSGNDTLNGGGGKDTLDGKDGDDTYVIDSADDTAKDSGTGIDTVKTSYAINDTTNFTNVENFIFTGKGDWTFVGNTLDNHIIGGAGGDNLSGGDGNDILDGGKGNDALIGGKGNDTYIVDSLGDAVTEAGGQGTDTVKTSVAIKDTTNYANVENFIFTGKGNWTFTADGADNAIQGGAGNDTLDGGAGDDTAVFAGKHADYQITHNADGSVTVKDLNGATNGADGTDILSHFEHLKFSDGTFDVPDKTAVVGQDTLNFAGQSVSAAGDVNGDGFADFVVGAPSAPGDVSGSGAAYILYGKPSGLSDPIDLGDFTSADGVKLSGVAFPDGTGLAVAAAGDVNGDGYSDVIIGAPNAHGLVDGTGGAYVVFGSGAGLGTNIDLGTLNGSNGFKIDGFDVKSMTGSAVSSGDINGDGFTDLIIGAYSLPYHQDYASAGQAYVVFGHAGSFSSSVQLTVTDGSVFRFSGDNISMVGYSVSSGGDVNGDGIDDLVIGAPGANGTAKYSGGAYVLFGHTGSFVTDLSTTGINGTNGFLIRGAHLADAAGVAVSSAGDVNGDGFADIVVSAPGADPHGSYSGAAYVIFGHAGTFGASFDVATLNGSNGFKISGIAAGDFTGSAVSLAGDFNGDGYDDLIIGAAGNDENPNAVGKTFVVFGHEDGFSANIDLGKLSSSQGFEIDGTKGDGTGMAVSAAGDVNGDGYDDLLLGKMHEDNGTGGAVVILGGNFNLSSASLIQGTTGNDTKIGTTAAEIIIGGQGADTLSGGGGRDVIQGGSGNDVMTVSDNTFNHVDGGGGFDVLKLNYSGAIDFGNLDGNAATSDRGKIADVEVINVGNGQDNTLTMHLADVLDLATLRNFGSKSLELTIQGQAGETDTLNLFAADGWSAPDTTTSPGYSIYTHDGVNISIDTTHIQVTIIP